MAESKKPATDVSRADASGGSKPVRSSGSPSAETARAADSVPTVGGPFTVLPMRFGRYEVRKELGKGQMGAVYLAYDTELDRLVALKVARISASGSAKLLKRMEIEAKSAAKVDHPLICKVHDAGEIDGIRFIALQYIEGEDLKQLMKRTGRRCEPDEAVRLVLQILGALEAAHDQGVIHRDLKPENVMLNKKQQPVIMDFGLARRTISSSDAGLTQGMIVGTAAYMSPEQATGKAEAIDHRSDLYAVGVMLFEMLTGEWPFTGGAIEVMGKKCVQEPPSPLSLNANLNSQLAAVCQKMIARERSNRYVTCVDAIQALEAIQSNASARPVASVKEAESESLFYFSGEPVEPPTPRKPSPSRKKRVSRNRSSNLLTPLVMWWNGQSPNVRWTMLGGAGACLLALAVILFFPTQNGVVRIDIDDPTLSVKFEGSTITMDNDGHPIRVSPTANHSLEVMQNGVVIEAATKEISLKRGEKRIVKVTLVDGIVVIDGKTVAMKTITSKSTGMKLTLIPAGTFKMGSPFAEAQRDADESPQHDVRITRPFYMSVYEVTQNEYEQIIGIQPSYFSQHGMGNGNVSGKDTSRFPVEQVTWYDAIEFCNKLSERDGLRAYYALTGIGRDGRSIRSAQVTVAGGNGYRLPTEAEWEYACRAGTHSAFHFGESLNGTEANVNGDSPYGTTTKGKSLAQTMEVGSYAKNEFELYDMHGNVAEWCFDDYAWVYRDRNGLTEDPIVTNGQSTRVMRGGHWGIDSRNARSAYRGKGTADFRRNSTGIRIVRNPPNTSEHPTEMSETKKSEMTESWAAMSKGNFDSNEASPFNGSAITSKSTGMKLTLIPAGTFTMGSPESEEWRQPNEGPQHTVGISRPFYLGVYEVTQNEYEKVMGVNPSWFRQNGGGGEMVSGLNTRSFPVEHVSWFDAIEFCNKLSQKDGLTPYYTMSKIEREGGSIKAAGVWIANGQGYRLPTEAEWEYACRARTTTPFHFGEALNGEKANIEGTNPYGMTVKGPYLKRTAPVGSYLDNEFGLFEMHGNVWEWCFDNFDGSAYDTRNGITKNPIVSNGTKLRVLRGGSWNGGATRARSAYRDWFTPDLRNNDVGFRVARSS